MDNKESLIWVRLYLNLTKSYQFTEIPYFYFNENKGLAKI